MRRVALREWLTILAAMLLLSLALGWQNGLGRLDQTLYDQFISASGRPARDDIIIIAIDDYSLAELGRWPWPRALHAELINRLSKAAPRIIGLDVILSEPERIQTGNPISGDQALADALENNRRSILPTVTANSGAGLRAVPPVKELADTALAIGHINLEHDSDGVVRSVFLFEGQNGNWWQHFGLALFDPERTLVPAPRAQGKAAPSVAANADTGRVPPGWQRTTRMQIPFAGNGGHFRSVPYVSVLRGEVSDQFFADKYVLIGATAAGMSDSYPTAVSGKSGSMNGIEINANVLAALLDHEFIALAHPWQTALFSMMPVLLAMLSCLLLTPRISLLQGIVLAVLTLLGSYAALRAGLWLPPSAALIGLLLSYPLWSWRRLEAAIAYLGQEFSRLDREPHLLPEAPSADAPEQIEDVLERRINAMKTAARRVRDLRQFVSDSLDNLPDATLVTDTRGIVLLANRHAIEYFGSSGIASVTGTSIIDLFTHLNSPQPLDQTLNSRFDWSDLLNLGRVALLGSGVGVRDEQGRDLLIKSAACQSASNELIGWIVNVADISSIRAAERSRDETLRFLSHDMRAPQASILALLELQNEPESALPLPELFARIARASRKTLGLADNFVQLARAESQEYRLEEVDFQDILFDASDEMWTQANNKHIKLVTDIVGGDFPVHVDRVLMTRVLANLLSNAINYSPENTTITWTVRYQYSLYSSHIVCSLTDQGYGIDPADQAKLFHRFQRVDHAGQPRHEGIGLGLVFVKTVVERHHGQVTFFSKIGEGTTFTLILPCDQV